MTPFDPDTSKATFILSRVACRGRAFSSDDLRQLIEDEGIQIKIPAIGKALAEAKVSGLIKCVGEVPSRRPENHSRKVDLWELSSDRKPPSGNGTGSITPTTRSPENSNVVGEKFSPSQQSMFEDTLSPAPSVRTQ